MDLELVDKAFRSAPLFQKMEEIESSGDYATFDTEAKRQHYVPQFLLRRFSSDAAQERVVQLDISTGQPRGIRIDEAASKRHFYAVIQENGERNNRVEGFLSMVESYAAPALSRLLDEPAHFSDADKATLSFFFALQGTRTPEGIGRLQGTSDVVTRTMLAMHASDPQEFAADYRHVIGEAPDEEIEALREWMLEALKDGRVQVSDPQAQALQAGLDTAATTAYVIFELNWSLERSGGGLVTSDRGLAMYDPTPPFPFSGNAWLSSDHAETTIPLSADACLLLCPGDRDGVELVEVDDSRVAEVNLRTYGWAGQFIYGPSQAVVTDVRREAKRFPQRVARPRASYQILLLAADPSDTELADANERRGWPRYLPDENGMPSDYVVAGSETDVRHVAAMISAKVEDRARRALGLPEGTRPPGGMVTNPVNPPGLIPHSARQVIDP